MNKNPSQLYPETPTPCRHLKNPKVTSSKQIHVWAIGEDEKSSVNDKSDKTVEIKKEKERKKEKKKERKKETKKETKKPAIKQKRQANYI